mgnify:CR=1 FL=1
MKLQKLHKLILIFAVLFTSYFEGVTQIFTIEKGIPFILNYSQNIYNAHEQTFDITQDTLGFMYFANFEAVVIYDGAEWTKVPTRNRLRVLAVEAGTDGRVYVGGLFDFGFVHRNSNGSFSYTSLADSTISQEKIGEIFSVQIINNDVYFISKERIFIFKNNKIQSVDLKAHITSVFVLNQNLYVFFQKNENNSIQNGLTKFVNGSFIKITDKSSTGIFDAKIAFDVKKNNISVIGTSSQGFYQLKNDTIYDLRVFINDFVKENTVSCGAKINDSLFAVGTVSKGFVFVNNNGLIIQNINKKSTLIDETINALFIDKSNNLWVATNNGISLVEINNPLTQIHNSVSGINGKINKIINFNSKLLLATDYGLYSQSNNTFEKINDIDIACFDIIAVSNCIYTATPQGIYTYFNNSFQKSQITDFSFCFTKFNELLFLGQNSKILIIKPQNDNLQLIDQISGLIGNIIRIVVKDENIAYCENSEGQLFEINLKTKKSILISNADNYIALHINSISNQIFFSSEKGLFQKQTTIDTLTKFFIVPKKTKSSDIWLYELFNIKNNLYVFNDGSKRNLSFLEVFDTSFVVNQSSLLPIEDFTTRCFYYDEINNKLWIGGNESFLIYDFNLKFKVNKKFKVQITQILSQKNNLLFDLNTQKKIKIKYSNNSLIFRYSAPYYTANGKIQFRYYLEGFDKDTSDWTIQNFKEYTNIPSGSYTFVIQAKDQFGNIINANNFKFKILVPFYRKWWMFIVYLIVLGVLIKIFSDWRIRASEKEKEKLEDIIKERTEEIERSKAEIEAQRDTEYAQKKQIMASIEYAKRIQHAVLPEDEAVVSLLKNNYFIFYRPYEVVSGDFYWIKEIKNFVIVVAADCTGHGVPGAFMSMLGISFLNELISRRSLDSAGEILEKLRQRVKSSLHQEGKADEQKDGMDIAMYFIDKESLELQFAGAYNPLYIVRHNSNISEDFKNEIENNPKINLFTDLDSDPNFTLIELKANRQPIGIYIKEQPFNNVSLKLCKNDCIYSFSDGFQDQFGGLTGEKFNIKRFKSLFLSIQDKPMEQQKFIIEQSFIKWKGELDQIDDVLIIGVKIDF